MRRAQRVKQRRKVGGEVPNGLAASEATHDDKLSSVRRIAQPIDLTRIRPRGLVAFGHDETRLEFVLGSFYAETTNCPAGDARPMSTIVRLMPTGQLPVQKLAAKLIVLCAFDRAEDGTLQAAFEPREMPDERRAISAAREMARHHVGVIAWMREANPAAGEYGSSEVLYQSGEIPDLD